MGKSIHDSAQADFDQLSSEVQSAAILRYGSVIEWHTSYILEMLTQEQDHLRKKLDKYMEQTSPRGHP